MMIKSDIIVWLHDSPLHFFFDGQCAVVFFMVLSGFFYYKAEKCMFRKYLNGVWKKVEKIFPSHIIMILLGVIICNLQLPYNSSLFTDWSNSFWLAPIGLAETIKQMLIIVPGTDPYLVNSPVWYLVVEVRMFLLMPLLVGSLYMIRRYMGEVAYYFDWTVMMVAAYVLYPFALCYLIGYMTANVFKTYRLVEKKLPRVVLLGGVFLSLVAINIQNEIKIDNSEVNMIIQSAGVAVIILCCYMGIDWLGRTILAKLGDYSYEFYITHFVILLSCKCLVNNNYSFLIIGFVLSCLQTFILCYLKKVLIL